MPLVIFEISLVVFMPNITTNHAITYTNSSYYKNKLLRALREQHMETFI